MKKIYLFLFVILSLSGFAQQGPTVEGTYLPVRGTSVKNIWDVTSTISVPYPGVDTVWDYSNQFTSPTDTFQIKTFHPDSVVYGHCFSQYFPTATHASFLRSPLDNLSDSIYSYYIIDANGLHNIGGFNIRTATNNTIGYDTTSIINPSELLVSSSASYGMITYDTSRYVTYGILSNFPATIRGAKFKENIGYGYGTLKMPNGSVFNNVLLARQNIKTVDSVFLFGSYYTTQTRNFINYSFIRNNTFGSSYLMYMDVNSANTVVNNGWYALPVDFSSISGTVYDSLSAPVTKGEALLYRENSNFAKNDILDRDSLDINGNYQFDSIPYGEYRVAIRADSTIYQNTFTTYFGDTSNWLDATPIFTSLNSPGTGKNITLQYHPAPPLNGGEINGFIGLDLNVVRLNDPIPGIDIVVRKNPGGTAVQETTTDFAGNFTLNKLPALSGGESYCLFVDIPGLHMAGTYCNIIVISGTIIDGLDYTVGTDSIHPNSGFVGIKEQYKRDNLVGAYPNPYSSNTLIKINLAEKCDVLLEVYNLLGEKIKTLDNSQKNSGSYSYNFNAKSLNLPSGIYVVKLSAGAKTSILKIIEQ